VTRQSIAGIGRFSTGRLRLVIAGCGVALLAASALAALRSKVTLYVTESPTQSLTVSYKREPDPIAQITVPALIRVDDPFVLELKVEQRVFPRAADSEFQISAAGLRIEPDKQWLKPVFSGAGNDSVGIVRWSAKASTVGTFIIVANSRMDKEHAAEAKEAVDRFLEEQIRSLPPTARAMKRSLEKKREDVSPYSASDDRLVTSISPITVSVKPTASYYAAKLMPLLGGFLGSLLTLPGIFAFRDAREQRRKEKVRIAVVTEMPNKITPP
jgi:hypothetical protein